ncbi:MAG: glycosyltransferase [bacterium]|nr:glycosyltransferase [bacterium]
MSSYRLLTYDFPPRVGGAARYHGAVASVLGDACSVRVVPTQRHWLWELVPLLRSGRGMHVIVGEVLPLGTVAWLRAMLIGAPYSVICHGLDIVNASRFRRKQWIARRVLRRAAGIIVNSKATAALAARAGAPQERITVAHPPLGTIADGAPLAKDAARAVLGVRDVPLVLSVCRLVERKGIDTLIDAMARVRVAIPDVQVVVVGDGPQRQRLTEYAKRINVPLRIVTDASDAQLAQWYAAADVFVLLPRPVASGDMEGFGIVYLEAGAFGLPVVGTTCGGVPEAIAHQRTGLLVPPADADAAAQAIITLLTDAALAQRLGRAGKERSRTQHSMAAFADAILRALNVCSEKLV